MTDLLNFSMKLKLIYDRRWVGLGVGLPSGAHFCFLSDDCGFLDVGHPLWREDGSVIYLYNCFWTLPEQSLLGRSPAELTTIFYCLIWDSCNMEVQVLVFISPRNRVAQLYSWALGSILKLKLNYGWQSASPSWCQAPIWDPRPIFISPWNFL
jgi:hypothetical protein